MAPMLLIGTMAMQAIGGAVTAMGTLAAGKAQKNMADYEAAQLRENASGELGAGQRAAEDKRLQTGLLISKATAEAAGSGFNPSVGSPAVNNQQLAGRGEYQALMDVFQGENRMTGDLNVAAGKEYSGEAALKGSKLAAIGTIAGTAGNMLSTYGAFAYPNRFGRAGAGFGYG